MFIGQFMQLKMFVSYQQTHVYLLIPQCNSYVLHRELNDLTDKYE